LLRLFLVRLEADSPRQAGKLVFLAGPRRSDNSLKPFAIRAEIGYPVSAKNARLFLAILGDEPSGIVHAAGRGRPPVFAGARLVVQIEFGDAAAEVDASIILAGIELEGLVEISQGLGK